MSTLKGETVMTNKTQVKAISLWEPWASLVMIGAKKFETRSWWPNYTGPLAIQAAKKWNRELATLCRTEPFKSVLAGAGINSPDDFHFGCALGLVDLIEAISTEAVRGRISRQERAFGDYSDGRVAWRLDNARRFPEPLPVRGHQGLWYIDIPTDWLK